VLTGPANTNAVNPSNNSGALQQNVVVNNNQFRSFKTNLNLELIETNQFFKSTLFWCLLLLPLLAIPSVLIFQKKKALIANDVKGNKIRKADKLAKKFLSESKKNLNNKDAFYESLHKSLHNYLKAKLQIETTEFSKEKITALFEKNKINTETTINFVGLIESCDLARFTPITSDAMQQDFDKAVRVISEIDKAV
jgi:hypothetical protein